MPDMLQIWMQLPTTKKAVEPTPAARPRYTKKRIWKMGAASIVGMYCQGLIQ